MRSQVATFTSPFNTALGERTTLFIDPAPRRAPFGVKRIVGLLGGELDRSRPSLIGRVLEQRKARRPSTNAQREKLHATKVAECLMRNRETLNLDFYLREIRFLAASFSDRLSTDYVADILDWMLQSGVDVIVTLDPSLAAILDTSPAVFSPVKYTLPDTSYLHTKIWTIRNPLNTMHEHLSDSVTQQLEYSQELC